MKEISNINNSNNNREEEYRELTCHNRDTIQMRMLKVEIISKSRKKEVSREEILNSNNNNNNNLVTPINNICNSNNINTNSNRDSNIISNSNNNSNPKIKSSWILRFKRSPRTMNMMMIFLEKKFRKKSKMRLLMIISIK